MPHTFTFPDAVRDCADIDDRFLKSGLGALTSQYTKKITQENNVKISGSVYLDDALRPIAEAGDKCVDYAIGVQVALREDDCVIFLEVHEANDGSVKTVKDKFEFIKKWLKEGGTSLDRLKRKLIWIASGSSHLSQASLRRLNALGIVFHGGHLTINKYLFL